MSTILNVLVISGLFLSASAFADFSSLEQTRDKQSAVDVDAGIARFKNVLLQQIKNQVARQCGADIDPQIISESQYALKVGAVEFTSADGKSCIILVDRAMGIGEVSQRDYPILMSLSTNAAILCDQEINGQVVQTSGCGHPFRIRHARTR